MLSIWSFPTDWGNLKTLYDVSGGAYKSWQDPDSMAWNAGEYLFTSTKPGAFAAMAIHGTAAAVTETLIGVTALIDYKHFDSYYPAPGKR